MTYVHYDLGQAEQQMRALRAEVLPKILAGAEDEASRQAFLAQDALWEPMLALNLGVIRMVNEGRSPDFVGKTLGSVVGNTVINAVSNSSDPAATLNGLMETLSRVIASQLFDNGDDGVTGDFVELVGQRGGRA